MMTALRVVANLGALNAITVGTDASGNPTFLFTSPFSFSVQGSGLALFMDVTDNNTGGNFCYLPSAGCKGDLPNLLNPTAKVTSSVVTTPEPTSILTIGRGAF